MHLAQAPRRVDFVYGHLELRYNINIYRKKEKRLLVRFVAYGLLAFTPIFPPKGKYPVPTFPTNMFVPYIITMNFIYKGKYIMESHSHFPTNTFIKVTGVGPNGQ